MYLAIDIGGTKTLFAVFDEAGQKIFEHKILTTDTYAAFLNAVEQSLKNELKDYRFIAVCCALPGRLDRENGIGIRFGNLSWQNVPVRNDLKRIFKGVLIYIENDAKLGGLSEALLVQKEYKKVLYLTIGTGIGGSFIVNGVLEKEFLDMEPGGIMIEHDGKVQKWENFASGHALKQRYGKKASEITGLNIWREYVEMLAVGLNELISSFTPDVVIIGGGVGAYFDKFGALLKEELAKIANPMVNSPKLLAAKRPEEAVIYGCYEYIKQNNTSREESPSSGFTPLPAR